MAKKGICKKCGIMGTIVEGSGLCTNCQIRREESGHNYFKLAGILFSVLIIIVVLHFMGIDVIPQDGLIKSEAEVASMSVAISSDLQNMTDYLESIESSLT